jgi:hypothetical protein
LAFRLAPSAEGLSFDRWNASLINAGKQYQ